MDATSNFAGFSVSNSYAKRLQPNELKVTNGGTAIMDFSYCFYALSGGACPSTGTTDNGNVMAVINNMDTTRSQTFTYDALNRLSTGASVNTSGTNCWGEQYGYDAWANLLTVTKPSGYSACSQPDNLSISVSAANQVSGYTYDGAGDLNVIPGTGGGTFTYNAESEMTSTAGVNYTYDGDGKRVEKSNGTLYWYGMSSDALEETNLTGGWLRDYVFFGGQRIAARTPSSTVLGYFANHLGSTSKFEEISSTGSVTQAFDADYYPFGRAHQFTDSYDPGFKFEGKERDLESGLDNFGARFYTSNLGRFMSADWSAVPAPVPYANLTNPQTLNLYAMVSDNPETFADLDGHCGTGGLPGAPSSIQPCENGNTHADQGEGYEGDGNTGIAALDCSLVSCEEVSSRASQVEAKKKADQPQERKKLTFGQRLAKFFGVRVPEGPCKSAACVKADVESDWQIYIMTNPFWDPFEMAKPAGTELAEIHDLATLNLQIDVVLGGGKTLDMLRRAASVPNITGLAEKLSADQLLQRRDANNQKIDDLLGRAAAEFPGSGQQ